MSLTNLSRFYYIKLKNLNCKVPSYDKVKRIVEKFVNLGIFTFRGKEGKSLLYTINPIFDNKFKDDYAEILKL